MAACRRIGPCPESSPPRRASSAAPPLVGLRVPRASSAANSRATGPSCARGRSELRGAGSPVRPSSVARRARSGAVSRASRNASAERLDGAGRLAGWVQHAEAARSASARTPGLVSVTYSRITGRSASLPAPASARSAAAAGKAPRRMAVTIEAASPCARSSPRTQAALVAAFAATASPWSGAARSGAATRSRPAATRGRRGPAQSLCVPAPSSSRCRGHRPGSGPISAVAIWPRAMSAAARIDDVWSRVKGAMASTVASVARMRPSARSARRAARRDSGRFVRGRSADDARGSSRSPSARTTA